MTIFTFAAAALLAAAGPARQDAREVGWLAGDWVSDEGGRWTEERWAKPRGGVMLGTVLGGKGGGADNFEYMRIAPGGDGTLLYWASPRGKAAVPFRYERGPAGEAVFTNSANDYPQRIVYRRQGDVLSASISALDGSNPTRWSYRRRK